MEGMGLVPSSRAKGIDAVGLIGLEQTEGRGRVGASGEALLSSLATSSLSDRRVLT